MGMAVSPGARPTRILVAMFQGGGNIPLITPVVAALVARGHKVRVLAGPGVRPSRIPINDRFLRRIAQAGAAHIPFAMPATHPFEDAPPRRGLVRGWTPRVLAMATDQAVPYRWSPAWAENVAAELRREPADVLVADFVLIGALAAAEAARVPAAVLVHTVYNCPAPGLPPYGSGFPTAHGPLGRLRDGLVNGGARRIYRRDGLPPHNRARQQLGLAPLRSPLEQYDRAGRVLILASAAFDFPARRLPPNVQYVGTPPDDAGAPVWDDPWFAGDERPLVLVSLSTLRQRQTEVMHRILAALDGLAVRALVTLGPALAETPFDAPPNARLEAFVPHGAVLPHAAALGTQCGLSTVTKALAHGVPMVCIPVLGDQPDNAARVAARGAGVRLGRDASPEEIRGAIRRVVAEPRYREGARRLAVVLAREDGAGTAATEIEGLVGQQTPGVIG
jgi:UDP:flavonoid glycosyltransferase YjiC (YdhE family)